MSSRSQVNVGRVRLIFFVIVFVTLGLVYRLYSIQIVSGQQYTDRADRQYLNPASSLLNRGTIYFTPKDGDPLTAAYQETGDFLAIDPKLITDPEAAYEKINALVPIDKEDFLKRAGKKDDPYEEVAKKVSLDTGAKLQAEAIPGLQIYKQKWRAYPSNKTAANVLGFLGFDDKGNFEGRYGLEKQYEGLLRRTNEAMYANFFVEMFSDIKKTLSSDSSREADIVTTIEPTVQSYLDQTLEKVNRQWNSGHTAGIIMDPNTGEIIAMGQYPTFDPNNFSTESDPVVFSNRNVEDVYEMGSIIKPLTLAAGLDTGVITPTTTYLDTGSIILNNKKISNFDGQARGRIDMQEVLNKSLNLGAAFVEQKLGNKVFTTYFKNYGLDKKTGIDLPYEAAPLVDNLNSPRDVEHATASFGQGIAVSPIAAIRALATVGNGGKLVNPHVVSEIKYTSGLTKTIDQGQQVQVIKPETSEAITRMLVKAVDEALVNGSLKNEHYSVAAKTGTAQISNGKGYYEDRYLHTFFGYFPAYKPKYIIFLLTYYPKGVNYASETLAASFMDIVKYLINYYDIPPDR